MTFPSRIHEALQPPVSHALQAAIDSLGLDAVVIAIGGGIDARRVERARIRGLVTDADRALILTYLNINQTGAQ